MTSGHFQIPRTSQKTLDTCLLVTESYPDSLHISTPMGSLLFNANGTGSHRSDCNGIFGSLPWWSKAQDVKTVGTVLSHHLLTHRNKQNCNLPNSLMHCPCFSAFAGDINTICVSHLHMKETFCHNYPNNHVNSCTLIP